MLIVVVLVVIGGWLGYRELFPPTPAGPPVIAYQVHIISISQSGGGGPASNSNIISADHLTANIYNTRTSFVNGNVDWTLRVDFEFTNINSGPTGSQGLFITNASLALVDKLPSITSPFPNVIRRLTSDNTQYDITWSILTTPDNVMIIQDRDKAILKGSYGGTATIRTGQFIQSSVFASAILNNPYCITYLIDDQPLKVCLIAIKP